jgi:hypothetical protein
MQNQECLPTGPSSDTRSNSRASIAGAISAFLLITKCGRAANHRALIIATRDATRDRQRFLLIGCNVTLPQARELFVLESALHLEKLRTEKEVVDLRFFPAIE